MGVFPIPEDMHIDKLFQAIFSVTWNHFTSVILIEQLQEHCAIWSE